MVEVPFEARLLSGDEGGFGALVLDDSVGGHGDAVANFRHGIGSYTQVFHAVADALKDSPAVIVPECWRPSGPGLARRWTGKQRR